MTKQTRDFLLNILLLMFLASNASKAQQKNDSKPNLDFEKKMEGWKTNSGKLGYQIALDSKDAKQGKYSLKICPAPKNKKGKKRNFIYGNASFSFPAHFEGCQIELRGWVKAENMGERSFGGIWMNQKNENKPYLGYEGGYLYKKYLSKQWKEFKIIFPLIREATEIQVGGNATNGGIIWIDDLRLSVDGKPLHLAPKRVVPTIASEKNYEEVGRNEIRKNLFKSWKTVKEQMTQFHQQYKLEYGTSLTLIVDGKVYDDLYLGYNDRENKKKMDASNIHQWASISKTLTATAILQLVEKGKITLNDPITKYIPELKEVVNKEGKEKGIGAFEIIKLHHLITHSGHFRRDKIYDTVSKINPQYHFENTHCFEDWMKYKTLFFFKGKPGEKYHYSNWGYSFLGMVIERVTGMKFRDYIKENILDPLDMKDSFFGPPFTKERLDRMSASYQVNIDGSLEANKAIHDQCFEESNGALKATTSDMVKLINFYAGVQVNEQVTKQHAQVLKSSTWNRYFDIQGAEKQAKHYDSERLRFKANAEFTGGNKSTRINGLHLDQSANNQSLMLGHTGGQYYYTSRMFYNPKGGYAILETSNTLADVGTNARAFLRMLYYYFDKLLTITNVAID